MADPEQEIQQEELPQDELSEGQEAALVTHAIRETEGDLLKGAFERQRDPETGRFVAKEATEEPAQSAESAESPAEEKTEPKTGEISQKPDDEILPSWRAREINEERRRVAAENEHLRAQQARWQAEQAQRQRAEQAPQAPDPLLDPVKYTETMRSEFSRMLAEERLNMNLEMAHMRWGQDFEQAYEQLLIQGQRGNAQLVRHLTSQGNPGAAIMNWHRQNVVMRETGGDMNAYKQRVRDELLKDPEFLKSVHEATRQQAMGNGQGTGQQQPNTVVRLPPSLSKATGQQNDHAMFDKPATDGSETAMFANVWKR